MEQIIESIKNRAKEEHLTDEGGMKHITVINDLKLARTSVTKGTSDYITLTKEIERLEAVYWPTRK